MLIHLFGGRAPEDQVEDLRFVTMLPEVRGQVDVVQRNVIDVSVGPCGRPDERDAHLRFGCVSDSPLLEPHWRQYKARINTDPSGKSTGNVKALTLNDMVEAVVLVPDSGFKPRMNVRQRAFVFLGSDGVFPSCEGRT